MKERRLLLAPFFKDFDKYLGHVGRVTRSHFSRLCSTMKLDVSDSDLHILFKKFEDRRQAKVNYMEFIRTIDPDSK
jgi:Ca2+-binding EF-hand superfamily protein